MRNNPCPAEGCNREFARGMNLKAHIRTCHKELAKQMDEEGWPTRLEGVAVAEAVHESTGEEDGQMEHEVLLEAQAVEQNEAGEMTWVTASGDQVVQLTHGDAFSGGKYT